MSYEPEHAPLLPHNVEAERAVLGSVLINPDCYFDVAETLVADDFYIHIHRWIWDAFGQVKTIDYLTVSTVLENNGRLAEIGGPAYLTKLINNVPTSLNALEYADIVKQDSIRRKLLNAAQNIAKAAYQPDLSANDALAQSWGHVQAVETLAPVDGIRHISEHVKEFDEAMESSTNTYVLPTGFIELDRITDGGLWTERTYLLMGFPKTRKTIFMTSVAVNVALKGYSVAIFSLEMPARDLIFRDISARSKIPEAELRLGVHGEHYERYLKQLEQLGQAPIHLSDKSSWTIEGLRAEIHRVHRNDKLKAVFIDYLGLIADNPKIREIHDNLTWKARELKRIAKDFKLPVFAIHTLSAAGDLSGGTGPAYAVDQALRLVGDKAFKAKLPTDDPRKNTGVEENVIWLAEDFVRYGPKHVAGKMIAHPSLPMVVDAARGIAN